MSLEAHLPKWGGQGKKLGDALARSRYESRFLIDMSHRAAAKNLMLTTMLKAGQTLSDSNPEAPRIRTELLANAHLNLMFHNRDLALTPAEAKAAKIGSRGSGYRFIEAPGSGDQIQARAMTRLHKQEQRLKRQLDKSDAARRTAIENEIADVRSQIEDRQRYAYAQKYSSRSGSAAEFEKAANDLGNLALTRDVNKAARTADGKLYVVPKHDAKAFGAEMASSSRFARIVWDKPTYLWKMAMIGYTPRSIVNNAVGNWAMYALREGGGVDGVKALYDAVRLTHGDKVALESMKSAMPFKRNNWLYQNFGNELGNVFGHELLTAGARSKSALKKRLSEGLYPLVHQIADEPVRVASISKYLRGDAEVKRLMKGGLSFDDAAARALRNDSSLQRRASEHARAVAGDYFTLRGWEKTVRKLVPFYLWDRHIVRTTGNMFADTPGRLAIMQQLSNAGIEETERILGDIPDFLKGAIPLEMLGIDSEEGRNSVLTTASLNPWATIGEIVNLGQALTIGGGRTSDAMLGAHPFITGGIEFVTGRSVLSGAPKATDGGLVFSVAKNSIMGFPGIQLADELISEDTDTTSKGNPLLFSRDDKSAVSRFLGIPIREVDSETAARMKAAQNAGKAPAKKNPYGGG